MYEVHTFTDTYAQWLVSYYNIIIPTFGNINFACHYINLLGISAYISL